MGIELGRANRPKTDEMADAGSIAGRVAWVLGVVTLGFAIFVGLKYFILDNEEGTGPGTVYVTASATDSPSDDPSPTPTPTAGIFDGTWTGHVTGDLHTYDIEVVIVDDGVELTGDVEYTWNPARPGVDECVGDWTQTARHNKHADVLEVITSGDACIGELDITLDLKTDGTIAFAIFYSDDYHPKATLTRED